jgi:methyl-accepting chemotaxis protein
MRLLKSAAGGKFEPEKLPSGLKDSGVAAILMNIADTRTAIDRNPLPMVTVDADFNLIELNDAALKLFGLGREEALRLNVKALDILELKGDSIAVSAREKRPTIAEVKLRCSKGVVILKEWATPVIDAAGNVRAIHMEFVDITREKEAATDVAALYESILDAVPFPVSVTDLDMNWTFINKAVETFLGRTRAEVLGRPCREWQAGICNTSNCGITCLRRGQHQTVFEQNGGNFQVDVSYVKNARGENVGHVEIVQDISSTVKVSRYMEGEVQRLAGNLSRLAAGNLNFNTSVAPADQYTEDVRQNFVLIMESLAGVRDNVGAMLEDAQMLAQAAQEGRLQVRADAARHEGEFRMVVEGFNNTLDAVVTPLTEANRTLQRMAVNDYTVRMTGQYRGTYAEVATAINGVHDQGNHIAGAIEMISHGDLSKLNEFRQVGRLSEQDRIVPGFIRTLETLQVLTADTEMLTGAARKGQLSVRVDATKHEGEYRKIVGGINVTLDAIVDPIEVTANCIGRIGRGEIPETITTEYQGDFNKIKMNLNQCINGLAGLAEADHVLQRMAVNDHTVRMTGHYQGIFAEVATAVNDVQDRVNYVADTVEMISRGDLSRLENYRHLGRRSEQDRLVPAFIRTLETLKALVADTEMLTRAARKGELGVRADAAKHEGEYRAIVEGINETLDTIVVPFKKVRGAVVQLESSTQDTSKSSEEIAKATEQVAVTSQKCADLAKQVLEQIKGIESQITDLSASNEEVASTAQEVLGATNETAKTGRESLKLGEATKQKMAVVEKISRQSMDEIIRLNEQMTEIGKIVKLINDIANQTNLLALNAAIEAARAGEHGRGFAVVAGEIRNLAGESKKASHNIEDLITAILANSNKTAKNMEQVYAEIESGVESVNGTLTELKKIVAGAETISGDMGEIARAIEGQANVANRVVQAMDEGTRLTKETQAQVENLASLSEETSASTEEIGSAAHELNGMAGDLKATMQRFSF